MKPWLRKPKEKTEPGRRTIRLIDPIWDSLSDAEKNCVLYERQKEMLKEFLELGAISKAQYEKSLHDLTEKMTI